MRRRKGFGANTLTPFVGDANIETPEYKAFLVDVEPHRSTGRCRGGTGHGNAPVPRHHAPLGRDRNRRRACGNRSRSRSSSTSRKCIGCKACQAACLEWNDLREEIGFNTGVYDNPHDLTENTWTVMRFTEWENPGTGDLEWLIRKDGCMHCDDPGCLKACPAPGAIVQYANGIVDFISENCIGCGYCIKGCPFNIPRISQVDHKAYKCTLCSDRVAVGLRSRPAPRPARPRRSCSAPRRT